MKNFKKILAAVLSAAMVVTLAPVGAATTVEAAATTAIKGTTMKLSASKATLNVGKSKTIKVTLSKKQTKNAVKVTVKSSKSSVAKVNKSSVSVKKNAKTASFKITAKAPGSATVTVTCKTKAKKTLKKTVKVTVKAVETNEDNVDVTDGKITLVDTWGLQKGSSEGYIDDLLTVNIPVELGTMTSIIWYRDGNQIRTSSANGDGNTIGGGAGATVRTNIPGEYYAVAITAKGTTYKSNSIKIVDTEAAGEITAYTIENDYTDGNAIVYETKDTLAVVTATLKKGYEGTFKLYKKSDAKFTEAPASTYTLNGLTNAGFSNARKTNYDVVGEDPLGVKGASTVNNQKWRDPATGNVTVKFTATLTRGVEYVLAFDQKAIGTDTPGTGTANAFETAATAPYVTAPAKIVVDPVSDKNPVSVSFYDAEGAAMNWMTAAAGKAVSAVDVYNGKNSAVSKTDAKLGSVNVITKGTAKTAALADKENKWVKAYATTVAGVFGEKSATLESEAVAMNADIVTKATVGALASDPTSAEIVLENLADDAVVYLIKGTWNDSTSTGKNALTRAADFSEDDPTSYDGKVDAAKGVKSVTIANMFSKVPDPAHTGENTFVAVIMPKDATKFGRYTTASASLTAKIAKYSIATGADFKVVRDDGATPNTGTKALNTIKIVAADQYGQAIDAQAEVVKLSKTTQDGLSSGYTPWVNITTAPVAGAKNEGIMDSTEGCGITAAGGGSNWTTLEAVVVAGDTFTGKMSTGQTLTLKYNEDKDSSGTVTCKYWTISIS